MAVRSSATVAIAIACGFTFLSGTPAASADVIGVVTAANPAVRGTPPGGSPHVLAVGSEIVFGERIATDAGGSAHLTFRDRSTISIGANSAVTIDAFVFNPDASAGEMSVKLSKGLMRFVGGAISHSGGMSVTTPTVTVGIRGGIATVSYLGERDTAKIMGASPGSGGTLVVNHYGDLALDTPEGAVHIARPGFGVFVGQNAAPLAEPFRITSTTMEALAAGTTSRPGQRGGTKVAVAAMGAGLPAPTIRIPQPTALTGLVLSGMVSGPGSFVRTKTQAQRAVQQTAVLAMARAAAAASAPATSVAAPAATAAPGASAVATAAPSASSGSSSGSAPAAATTAPASAASTSSAAPASGSSPASSATTVASTSSPATTSSAPAATSGPPASSTTTAPAGSGAAPSAGSSTPASTASTASAGSAASSAATTTSTSPTTSASPGAGSTGSTAPAGASTGEGTSGAASSSATTASAGSGNQSGGGSGGITFIIGPGGVSVTNQQGVQPGSGQVAVTLDPGSTTVSTSQGSKTIGVGILGGLGL